MTDKSSRWAFTAYEQQYCLFTTMPPGVHKWGWNVEVCPTSQREHYQGWIQLKQQQRFSWMKKTFPGLHVEIPRNWEALQAYCMKEETRKEGTEPHVATNDIPSKYGYAEEIAKRLATHFPPAFAIKPDSDEILDAVQVLVRSDIRNGRRGVEWIAANPDWKVVWKGYGVEMYLRATQQTDRQTDNEIISPVEYTPCPAESDVAESDVSAPPPAAPAAVDV